MSEQIRAHIYHWHQGPQTYRVIDGETVGTPIILDDLQYWIEQHGGAIQILPPAVTKKDYWIIITTDKTNRFGQR